MGRKSAIAKSTSHELSDTNSLHAAFPQPVDYYGYSNKKIHKDFNWPGLGPKKVKNVLFSCNKEKEELITHLTMVIGRQFSHWSCKLGYFNLSFVVPLKASKKNLSLSWFHTWNNDKKKKDKKVNHLFTPPAAHNCLCGTSSLALKTFPNEIKPSIGCPAKEKKKEK